jgi:DNA polymerase-3 subunit beta
MQVTSSQNGSFTVPAKALVDILKPLTAQSLSFDIDLATFAAVKIQSAYGTYELVGNEAGDYMEAPPLENAKEMQIPAAILLEGINRTVFACCKDNMRPFTKGVYMKTENNTMTFVATDMAKLAKYQFNDIGTKASAAFIVPKKALVLLNKVLTPTSPDVQIYYNRANAVFYIGSCRVSCHLIDGYYPDYEAIMPKELGENVMVIDRAMFLASIKRLSKMANKKQRLSLSFAATSLTIEAEDVVYSNKAIEQLPCNYTGIDKTYAFSAALLIDIIEAISTPKITFEIARATPKSSEIGVMRPDKDIKGQLTMLIMPML